MQKEQTERLPSLDAFDADRIYERGPYMPGDGMYERGPYMPGDGIYERGPYMRGAEMFKRKNGDSRRSYGY